MRIVFVIIIFLSGVLFGAGQSHTVILQDNGDIRAFGDDTFGQSGTAGMLISGNSMLVGQGNLWIKLSSGSDHNLAINSLGELYSWGENSFGQLGAGDNTERNIPTLVNLGESGEVKECYTGTFHSFAIMESGNTYVFGRNHQGQLGVGDLVDKNTPVLLNGPEDFKMLSGGADHSLALGISGNIYGFGSDGFGQLAGNASLTPVQISMDSDWKLVECGYHHSGAIKVDGRLFVWGKNSSAQLGSLPVSKIPELIEISSGNWSKISFGGQHSLAINQDDGMLYVFGSNAQSQLGDQAMDLQDYPIAIGSDNDWKDIIAAPWHSIGIKSNGNIYAWGLNEQNQIDGSGDHEIGTPVLIYESEFGVRPFKLLVDTTQAGESGNNQFILPLRSGSIYDFNIHWGDGNTETITSDANVMHTYTVSGNYMIEIYVNKLNGFPGIQFNNQGDRQKVIELAQWGDGKWEKFAAAFYGCKNMTITATDSILAKTASVKYYNGAFLNCSSLISFPWIDTSGALGLKNSWKGCSKLTSFPLIDTSNVTDFFETWRFCYSLSSFPLINTSNGINFQATWSNCEKLLTFPLIDTSNGTNYQSTWSYCSNLISFPLINTSNGTNFDNTWSVCSSLASFPLLDTSSGNVFKHTWAFCSDLTSFPLLDTSNGTNFDSTWAYCGNLTSFPLLDTSKGQNFNFTWGASSGLSGYDFPTISMANMISGNYCFNGVTLSTNSYSDLLVDIEATNSNANVVLSGGLSQFNASGNTARENLVNNLSWIITDGGLQ